MVKRINLTPEMGDALALVARAEQIYQVGHVSYTLLELPKLALADATIAAVRQAEARQQLRDLRLAKLPSRARPTLTPVVEVSLRPKRRRA